MTNSGRYGNFWTNPGRQLSSSFVCLKIFLNFEITNRYWQSQQKAWTKKIYEKHLIRYLWATHRRFLLWPMDQQDGKFMQTLCRYFALLLLGSSYQCCDTLRHFLRPSILGFTTCLVVIDKYFFNFSFRKNKFASHSIATTCGRRWTRWWQGNSTCNGTVKQSTSVILDLWTLVMNTYR